MEERGNVVSTFTDSQYLYRNLLKQFHYSSLSSPSARPVMVEDVFGNWYPTLLLSRTVQRDGTVAVFDASASGAVFRPSGIVGRHISSSWPWLFSFNVPISGVRELEERPEILKSVCAAIDNYFSLAPGMESGPERDLLRTALLNWDKSHMGIGKNQISPATKALLERSTPLRLPRISRVRAAIHEVLPGLDRSL